MEDESHSSFIRRLFHFLTKRRFRNPSGLEREIQDLIDEGEERGLISLEEGDMIQGVLELGDTFAREIMTPRIEIVGTRQDAPLEKIIQLFTESGHSRYPVYTESLDEIVGILHVKDLLRFWGRGGDARIIPEIERPPYFVPVTKRINRLLREMLDKHVHMAIVTDEYGGTAGLITIEDILEEIVGEIHDEHDRMVEHISSVDENTYLVDARTHIEDLEESLGIKLPPGDYGSLGGFLIHLLGKVPSPSEKIQYKDLTFTIQSADPRRIERVMIARNAPSSGSQGS